MAKTVLQILKDNISDPSVFFVFPTQVAADSWVDELLSSLETGTIALERFTAWDTFKGNSIRSQQQDKTSIPSELRKLFAARLIAENAALVRQGCEPLFRSLINPLYAHEASSFTDWISSLLPQLALWKKKQGAALTDPEDVDLERLYEAYRDFLEEKKLFDPAWETPPFDGRGNRYIIFYPEILEDFAEYQELLSQTESIQLVKAADIQPLSQASSADGAESAQPFIRTYDNSRAELHALVLEIKRAHEKDGIPYEDMSVSIDRDALLLPYLERELSLYSIPANSRIAKPLTSRGAGMLFPQIQECISSDFSFESVKDLLLNNDLPWKEKPLNMELINFGIKNSCICSFEKNGEVFDVWKDALKAASHTEERLSTFYDMLKLRLTNIAHAKSFKEIEESYFAFRNDFFNPDEFTGQADNVLGRCIKELADLIRIQSDFSDMQIDGCFSFYTRLLAATKYLEQTNASGVVLYPYRDAAAAPKALHFIPAAGQDAVTVTYSPLRFLSQEKRAQLGVEDSDVSAVFLKMYGQNGIRGTWYSCAEKSFAGYTLPHSALPNKEASVPTDADPVIEQRTWLSGQQEAFPAIVSETDKAGFAQWSSLASELSSPDTALDGINKAALFEGDKVRISESSLKDFFACPRIWYYARCIHLKPFSLEADLLEDVFIGTVYHKIMELFFTSIKMEQNNQLLKTDIASVRADYTNRIRQAVSQAMDEAEGSPMTRQLLKKQENAYLEKATNCLMEFCMDFAGCSVVDTEKELSMTPEGKDYMFTGKIDLILRNNEGNIILIDYKTTTHPVIKDCFPDPKNDNRLVNFQFAMYIKLWEHEHPEPENAVSECHFYVISDCKPITIISSAAKSKKRADMNASIAELEACSEMYAEAVKGNTIETGFKPVFATCSSCRKYKALCRSTYTVSGDKSLIAAQKEQNDD